MRNCREITSLISRGMDKPLTRRDRLSIYFHTMMCRSCHNFQIQTRFLRKAAGQYTEQLGSHSDQAK